MARISSVVLILLVLLAVEAGAGDLILTTCPAGSGGMSHLPTGYLGPPERFESPAKPCTKEIIKLQPDPCLAQMEAAMRAMDPFMPLTVSIEVQEWVQRVLAQKDTKHNAALIKEGELRALQYAEIGRKWDAAKRECWRSP